MMDLYVFGVPPYLLVFLFRGLDEVGQGYVGKVKSKVGS